jgi:PAS domain S-box-containing protein
MTIQKKIIAAFFLSLLALGGIAFYLTQNVSIVIDSNSHVSVTKEVLKGIDGILPLITELESEQKGYVTTGDKKFYNLYNSNYNTLSNQISSVRINTQTDPLLKLYTDQALRQINNKLMFMMNNIRVRETSAKEAESRIMSGEGLLMMGKIKETINEMHKIENDNLEFAVHNNEVAIKNCIYAIVIGSVLIFIFFTWLLFVLNSDLNKRHRAEELAVISENKYKQLVEGAGDVVCVWNEKGNFNFVSQRAENLFGYKAGELLTMHYSSFIAPEWIEKISKSYEDQLKAGVSETLEEFQIITSGGAKKWVEQKVVIHKDKDGKAEFLGIIRDIDERKRKELEMISASHNQEIFLANMSHEIRTPMNGIIGMTHLLNLTPTSSEQKEYLNGISDSSKKLLTIINDILDISKINSGKIMLEEKAFSVKNVVNNLLLTFDRKVHQKGIYLQVNIDNNIPEKVIGDDVRLSQILWNLTGNAVKFTEKGGVTINISISKEDQQKLYLKMEVKDTGIGIEKDQLTHIFDPYIQANTSINRKYGGTGLGLSITKKLVEMQGGTLVLNSKVGEGTIFTADIGFKKYLTHEDTGLAVISRTPAEYDLHGLRVLIAEDNKINQKVGVKMLSKWGIEADTAKNGKVVIEMLVHHAYDLILMDLQMPEMDGLETTKYIRAKMPLPVSKIPIIAITAANLQGEYDKCMAAGMNDYVLKPFEPQNLKEKISKYAHLKNTVDEKYYGSDRA